jgi:N-acetylmuramate 1-kinase
MKQEMTLTPAQVDFLSSAISDFTIGEWNIELAGRAASQRYFVRVSKDDRSFVLVVWDSHDEDWERFLSVQKDLLPHGKLLPDIYKDDPLHGLILEEDLGAVTLKKFCVENVNRPAEIESIYQRVLDTLLHWQQIGISVSKSIASRSMDYETFMWESGYFARFCVTDFCACEKILDDHWERERHQLATLASSLPVSCIHRDFQSENIMLHQNKIRFVDYQGARIGPGEYDLASLLFDPYISLLSTEFIQMLFIYYKTISGKNDNDHSFYLCAAQRLMQALGAYGNLSLHKGKEWYRSYIPLAMDRLVAVLAHLPEFPHINRIANECRICVPNIDIREDSRHNFYNLK